MPSTEFLLYLVIVIFAIFMIMNYYKDGAQAQAPAPTVQYKYIPVYRSSDDDNKSTSSGRSNGSGKSRQPSNGRRPQGSRCRNPSGCAQYGRCICNEDIDIDVHNDNHSDPEGPMIPHPPFDPLRKFDHDALNDDFTPPFRRSYYDEYNYRLHPGLYPTYTRGPPGRFRKVGVLVAEGVTSNDKYKFLLLMGRQKYNNRDYEYFATSADSDQRLKFYIETRGKEINHDDIVKIPELEGYTYKFREDQDLSPRYDPYIV
ncbi:hypothetical protein YASMINEVIRUS_455 [Yasminevirus sp. GU-2018]|uniref:Uncharacterized protein n=1 Tax=Yasminevirus sp. GU-2018 TaxID=2420051 RepID=A0A5K0U994_9VIRU|nr:hypothetical protein YASMINEVIRUS_455 [Yasminevirus sp. GU-2018]